MRILFILSLLALATQAHAQDWALVLQGLGVSPELLNTPGHLVGHLLQLGLDILHSLIAWALGLLEGILTGAAAGFEAEPTGMFEL